MKKIFGLLVASLMMISLSFSVAAEETNKVTFDGEGLTPSFTSAEVAEEFSDLQPGDTTETTVVLENTSDEAVDFYITSEIAKTFEALDTASGAAYSYEFSFNGTTMYSNDSVGGEGSDGLKELNNGDEWVYLGTVEAGKTATVALAVGLDGHSVNNGYFNSDAELNLTFAAQPSHNSVTTEKKGEEKVEYIYTSTPNTGDESTSSNRSMIFFGCGLLVLLLALVSMKMDRKEAK